MGLEPTDNPQWKCGDFIQFVYYAKMIKGRWGIIPNGSGAYVADVKGSILRLLFLPLI